MKIGKHTLPDECPNNCFGKEEIPQQGGICHRCPIFNCVPDETGFCLLDASEYNEEWAGEYLEFFITGKYPSLRFKICEEI